MTHIPETGISFLVPVSGQYVMGIMFVVNSAVFLFHLFIQVLHACALHGVQRCYDACLFVHSHRVTIECICLCLYLHFSVQYISMFAVTTYFESLKKSEKVGKWE